jgi:hypothetical protein
MYHKTLRVTYLTHCRWHSLFMPPICRMLHPYATITLHVIYLYFCHKHVTCDIYIYILLPQTRCTWDISATNTLHLTYYCHKHIAGNTQLPQTGCSWHTTAINNFHVTYFCHRHVACDILYNKHVTCYILIHSIIRPIFGMPVPQAHCKRRMYTTDFARDTLHVT